MNFSMCYPDGRKKAITFSYDDGVWQDIRLVKIFNKYNLKATFNINSGLFSETDVVSGKGRMSSRQIYDLFSGSPHEVSTHTLTHPFLSKLSAQDMTDEVLKDRINLEKMFGRIIRGMAYPYGECNDEIVDCLKACGILYSRTVMSTERFDLPKDWLRLPATCHHDNPKLFDLADEFLNTQIKLGEDCLLFYVWGHSYEFDTNDNWDRIEKFAQLISGHNDIWYATNIEVYDYVNAYKQLQYSADTTLIYNPTQIDIWVNSKADVFKIKAGSILNLNDYSELN